MFLKINLLIIFTIKFNNPSLCAELYKDYKSKVYMLYQQHQSLSLTFCPPFFIWAYITYRFLIVSLNTLGSS
jgi:hypothetical protein